MSLFGCLNVNSKKSTKRYQEAKSQETFLRSITSLSLLLSPSLSLSPSCLLVEGSPGGRTCLLHMTKSSQLERVVVSLGLTPQTTKKKRMLAFHKSASSQRDAFVVGEVVQLSSLLEMSEHKETVMHIGNASSHGN